MGYYDYRKGQQDAFNILQTKYLATKYCPDAKKYKEQIGLDIAEYSKKGISSDYWSGYASEFKKRQAEIEAYYKFGDCENFFNKKKLEDVAKVVGVESDKYEKIISEQTSKQNRIVLGIGALIMLLGTVIIFTRKK